MKIPIMAKFLLQYQTNLTLIVNHWSKIKKFDNMLSRKSCILEER
jgi:hypothetical protein